MSMTKSPYISRRTALQGAAAIAGVGALGAFPAHAQADKRIVLSTWGGDYAKLLTKHAASFWNDCAFDLARKPKLDSIWVNLLRGSGHHSAHIHPHSIVSGTLYVQVPKGSGAIRFEDPRLPLMMAAPTRRPDAPDELQPFITVEPRPGLLLLWESWLRHEVLPGTGRG